MWIFQGSESRKVNESLFFDHRDGIGNKTDFLGTSTLNLFFSSVLFSQLVSYNVKVSPLNSSRSSIAFLTFDSGLSPSIVVRDEELDKKLSATSVTLLKPLKSNDESDEQNAAK
eukprot:TRINITY_DN7428_c0_g1_i1.p1 TRINITY_DN7428_c0_g1~~TRINITY_DN7428_c0_g1_i1.p1  ORF type:complete len:114 (-),score=12.35 TRINITY_DN7428_c0_g1_i1:10-351(-)